MELSSEMYPHIESADMEIFIATLLEVLSQSSKQLPTMNKNLENIFWSLNTTDICVLHLPIDTHLLEKGA